MEISFAEVKSIVDELPIGYYAKRRIKLSLGKEESVSYYNPTEDEIVISYPQIMRALSSAGEKDDYRETAIRSTVYHEVSHAMMTPKTLREYIPYSYFDAVNVFEDERMETILKNFYKGVNFKKNILYICGGKINPPRNAFEAFFNLVRFRAYKDASFLDEVNRIIEKYPNLYDKERDPEYWYVHEVVDLYNRVEEDWKRNGGSNSNLSEEEKENLENQINEEKNGEGYSQNDKNGDENKNTPDKKQGEGNGEKKEGKSEKGNNAQGNSDGSLKDETGNNSEKDEGDPSKNDKVKNGEGGQNFNPFEPICSKFHDTKTTEMFKSIIETFNKKNSSGNGCHGYSGIFNPRNFKNEDYKFFDRKISTRGNNRFGKFHLNLFVDESGSFNNLQDAANSVICSLAEVEKQNPNFSFDLICDSYGFRETDKKHRMIKANGGNGISYDEVIKVMKKHTVKDAYVYNIVLHDGSICFRSWDGRKNPFLGWDRNNVTIIDTGDNRSLINQCNNARTVYSPYSKLVDNLANEIANALKVAFR